MPPKNPNVDLRRKYQRMFEVGVIVSIAFVIFAFRFFPEPEFKNIDSSPPEIPTIGVVVPPTGRPLPPPPPKPPIPVEAPTDDDLEDYEIEDTELEPIDNMSNTNVDLVDDNSETYDDIVFIAVEDMPAPIGGISELQKKVVYPEIAVRAGVQGKVFVKAIVKKDGNLDSVHVVKGIGAGCDQAAVDAIVKSKFKPGTQRGKPVNVWISIPIKFQLN